MSREIELNETEPAAPAATVDESARRALQSAPTDKLARAVAMSKIAGALFAKREPVKLGRYHLLEQVGAGGMGVVWGAWDPELDRRVAIKVVKPELAAARERIVREGQALAKLSNPHVVPVYDVGVVDEQVYLVMEWVRGDTLRAWATKPRTIKEIVFAYREAALGLAAAHDTGLVHRDFKPENAMIGADGRVRVLDFGLAQAGGDAGGIAGTPRYMAPEQHVPDGMLTAAVDQYAVGISLKETLPTPPPKWLALIIARAIATAPADRFPSMHALVAALGNDPARIRRRRIAIAGALGLAGATFAIGTRAASSDAEERCVGGPAEIASAWDARAAETVRAHLAALGPYGAQLAGVAGKELEGYASRWITTQKAACRANDRGELTQVLYTSQLACLTRAKVSLATARDVLANVKHERLGDAFAAMKMLPAVEHCRTDTTPQPPAALAPRVTALDNDLARARVLAKAIDPRAIEASAATLRAADEIGYPRQMGQAALVHGAALLLQSRRSEAVPVLIHASEAALEANDDATAIEAIARQLFAVAQSSDISREKIVASIAMATPIARGLTADGSFARALYYNNVGVLKNSQQAGDEAREEARTWLREAERSRPAPSPDNYELATIYGNLALVEPDRERRNAYFLRESNENEAALGTDHPLVVSRRVRVALFTEHAGKALALLQDCLARFRTLHPHLGENIGQTAYQIVWLAEEAGDLETARDALNAITAPDPTVRDLANGYRLLLAGDYARARAEMTLLAARQAKDRDFYERWRSVDANIIAALAAQDQRAVAVARLESALTMLDALILERHPFGHYPYVERRRGRVLAMLVALGAGDVVARKEAALDWARIAHYDARVAQLTAN